MTALVLLAVFALLATAGGLAWWVFAGAAPVLKGTFPVAGLAAPVEIRRDALGVPTIDAANRQDLARALGFLHAEERFFQMDLQRRSAAGELSELVGRAALPLDVPHRIHRFRARAESLLRRMPADQRDLLEAYTEGVNAGLRRLSRKPFEYTLLGGEPAPWRAEDTLLCIYAMYFDLQDSTGWVQRRKALALATLGPELTEFLYPKGTPYDAALDGSVIPDPPIPGSAATPTGGAPVSAEPPPPTNGSNAFAVAGRLTGSGAAMVANDMHLGLRVPDIWYRARMRITRPPSAKLDLDGVTLPGAPLLVTGSNGKVAWGFTNSEIATGDAILLDAVPGEPQEYQTPDGPKPFTIAMEQLCPARAACQDLKIEETVWGPVVARDRNGRRIVWRWAAQDSNAIELEGALALETAAGVREALDDAHRAGIPQQNFVVGDRDGHIGWTIIGQVPRRIGLDDNAPSSWADGTHGWAGYLPADQVPEIVDPPDGIIWTANQRILGGELLEKLGDAGYAAGGRAREIRDDLKARHHFAEADLLAIQLDAHAPILEPWQALLLKLLRADAGGSNSSALLPYVEDWGGAAATPSVGYRIVRTFEEEAVRLIYGGFGKPIQAAMGEEHVSIAARQPDWPCLRLLEQRPASLVPPPFRNWTEVEGALLSRLKDRIAAEAGGDPARFTWGARNHTGIHHPLARAIPLLGRLTDPADEPVAGDSLQPRVVTPGFGASERFVVSPGHEENGIMELPVGEAGNPATPYYLAGQRDWVEGRPSPFLPGPPVWTLILTPG